MATYVSLRYIGKKPSAVDNIAHSRVTWDGYGDTQMVTDAQAKMLLKFPDQWELDNPEDQAIVDAPQSIVAIDEDGDPVVIDPDALKKPLERMSKAELVAYAFNKWGKTLVAKKKSTKDLIDQIEEWEVDVDVKVGVGWR